MSVDVRSIEPIEKLYGMFFDCSRIKLNHDNNELLISNLVIEDSGIYQCWGKNGAGTAVGTSRIYIETSGMSCNSVNTTNTVS